MFCKYCGKKIDEKTMQCIGCGKPAGPLEGGVGFWDLAGERPSTETSFEPRANSEKTEKKIRQISLWQYKLNKKIAVLSAFIAIAFIGSVILGTFLLGRVHRLHEDCMGLRDSMQVMLELENDPALLQTPEEVLFAEGPFAQFPQSDMAKDTIPTEFLPDPTAAEGTEIGEQADTIPSQDRCHLWQMWDKESRAWINADPNLIMARMEEMKGEIQGILLLKNGEDETEKIYFCCITPEINDESEMPGTEDSE